MREKGTTEKYVRVVNNMYERATTKTVRGSEKWQIKKAQEKRIKVAEKIMLRWSCGGTRLDGIRNEVLGTKSKFQRDTREQFTVVWTY